MEHYDILIIGAGAAGIAAAKAASAARVLLVDAKPRPGGVLLQCAHRGFGRNLTGPEYVALLLEDFPSSITLALSTDVLEIRKERQALLCSGERGRYRVSFSQLILATGCLEIPIGALPIAGSRPKGIYTAGQMQERMNLEGFLPEGPVVILGSGDLGLIMARQIAQAGLSVTMVEQRESCGGMAKNRHCLREYPIELHCNATVTEVEGIQSLEAVTLSDGRRIPCKTLLIAVGMRPDRELVLDLGAQPWLQLCGNCDFVHPMVEAVCQEGYRAGLTALEQLGGKA